MYLKTLSGRFLLLTVLFVMLGEIFIFVPSVARFRQDYILSRLERAQIASLSLLAAGDMIDEALERELLENAEVYNVVLRRDEIRQLVLSSPIPSAIEETYDLRTPTALGLIRDAMHCLLSPRNRVIRVIGDPVRQAGLLIEATMPTEPLRNAMIDYGLRVLVLSAVISALTAALLFLAVRRLLVTPIRRVVTSMSAYAEAPEDVHRVIDPRSDVVELREAEVALQMMQMQLTASLKQKERLAQLGSAVARISHDLRNILATAQIIADRLEASDDPMVRRTAPKLVGSLGRAVGLCESTLAFGKAEETAPVLTLIRLADLARDVVESETLAASQSPVEIVTEIPPDLRIEIDQAQMYRVLSNLIRNARQAIEATGAAGTVRLAAGLGDDGWWLTVSDTGPGLPEKARDNLFRAFQGGARKGGTGLGLAIASELVRGHGGKLELVRSDATGTLFRMSFPRAPSRAPEEGLASLAS